ncbi:PHD finger domain protein, putative [Talaromyces stipitatus ATCC 10500]|uniref:Transcription factor BYE1 n=1 Tax=Talaromyces stipitatus (strain ATCC 10500 / CBS 375.48 / QM 6759 / NRRL 1006) TaxID=441959 RepID=B8LYQ4_TALSN|nr:PHD finger domain protein, putative [Talaromyces stipitatus ATCC 10500]EED23412.1 PHD finger domain protein, putative [Talaromyces stipitatus ATCC 10500]
MADEPRRSGRATKGQHKNLELVQDIPAKKGKKGQSKEKSAKPSVEPTPTPSEGNEEEIIRCICGEYEEEEDIERDMICCDQCSAWQHNDCMGLTFAKGEEPEEYYCEQCKPENHRELLEKMARGEKPWEEAARRRQQEIEEKKAAKRKKGKKGKKGGARPSDIKPETSAPSTPAASETPAAPSVSRPSVDDKTPAPAPAPSETTTNAKGVSTQKRKFDEHQEPFTPEAGPKQKQQRLSEPRKSVDKTAKASPSESQKPSIIELRTGVAEKPEDISSAARRRAADALVGIFKEQVTSAQKQAAYSVPPEKTEEDVARPLGLSVEHAMYVNLCGGSGEPNDAYKNQLRSIMFNVKANSSLRDRLLSGSLAPSTLATMSSQDMASEEQQQKDAEIKRAAEKQHIIMQEQGPRIRRTHKGEEVIEGDGETGTSESIFSSTAVRRPTLDAENAIPESPTGSKVSQPSAEPTGKPSVETHVVSNGDANRSHSPGFPTQDGLFPEVPAHLHQPLPVGAKVQADEEIDKLLKDEDVESPPYSPKDLHAGSDIWFGKLSMSAIAEFRSVGRHIAGADLSGKIPWSRLAPTSLVVDGRIDIELASDYLCGLRFSNSTDVTVMAISAPHQPNDRAGFDKLFNYFTERKRYGVVGKHPLAAVKDIYVIPVEAGSSGKPEFIQLLENNTLEDPTPDRVLLMAFVVKTKESTPSEQATPYHSGQAAQMAIASPLGTTPFTQGHQQQQQFASPTPGSRQGSQTTPSGNFAGSPPLNGNGHPVPQLPPQQIPNVPSSQIQPPQQKQIPTAFPSQQPLLVGPAAAAHVLGPQANAPAIQELLQKAPSADVAQLNIVREIITRNPAAANDYPVLMNAIQQYTSTTRNGQPSGV